MKRTEMTVSAGLPPLLKPFELDDLRMSSWCIDCPRMTLTECVSERPATYRGSGYIMQVHEGQLAFKLYCHGETDPRKPGFAYYDLVATDSYAREWHSNQFVLDHGTKTALDTIVCEGRLSELVAAGELPPRGKGYSGSELYFRVFESVNIPKSTAKGMHETKGRALNAWKFRRCRTDFHAVERSTNLLEVSAKSSDDTFPEHFENRVLEALQFVVGHPIHWTVRTRRTGQTIEIRLRSKRALLPAASFRPPLRITLRTHPRTGKITAESYSRLFEQFLKHTLQDNRETSQLWGWLDAVYEASSAPFADAEALTLSVVIESLLANEFPDLGCPSKQDEEWIRNFIAFLASWDGPQALKSRIKGAVGNFCHPSASDRLHELASKGAITNKQRKAWQELRHPIAHSYQSPGIPAPRFHELLMDCRVLFYHLVFCAIGYKGIYTDYRMSDWPTKSYPDKDS